MLKIFWYIRVGAHTHWSHFGSNAGAADDGGEVGHGILLALGHGGTRLAGLGTCSIGRDRGRHSDGTAPTWNSGGLVNERARDDRWNLMVLRAALTKVLFIFLLQGNCGGGKTCFVTMSSSGGMTVSRWRGAIA